MEKNFTAFVFFTIFVLLGIALSKRDAHRGITIQASVGDSTGALSKLEALLLPHVKVLDRDLTTFRYEAGDNGFKPKQLSEVITRESKWAVRFFDPSIIQGADVGPGVYAAMDPNATATWGRDEPQLFVLPIRRGSRILVGDNQNVPEQDRVIARTMLGDLACWTKERPLTSDLSTYGEILGAFRYSQNESCRKLIIQVFQSLRIQATLYHFNSVNLKDCRNTGTAISIVDPSSMILEKINFYSETKKIEGDPSVAPYFMALFREGRTDFDAKQRLNTETLLAKSVSAFGFFAGVSEPYGAFYYDWKRKNLMKCGSRWSIEDELSDFDQFITLYSKNTALVTADPLIQDLYLRVKFAYGRKTAKADFSKVVQEFSVTAMRAFIALEQVASEANSGIKMDFETYLQGRQAVSGFEISAAESALSEKFAFRDSNEFSAALRTQLRSLSEKDQLNPNLIPTLLTRAGMGPTSTRIFLNNFSRIFGGTPYLESKVPKRLDENFTDLFEKNKSAYKKLLNRCLDIYSNPELSVEKVIAGPCGLIYNKK